MASGFALGRTRLIPQAMLHIEIAGPTCTPWSRANQDARGWLEEASLPCLVWIASLARARPHAIVAECVPAFDAPALQKFLVQAGADVPYSFDSIVFGPDTLGIPASRDRRYSVFLQKDVTSNFNAQDFKNAVAAEMQVDGRIFMRATRDQVKAFLDKLAASRQIPPRPDGKSFACQAVLSPSDRLRLQKCIDKAASLGPRPLFIDVKQSVGQLRVSFNNMPCLMRESSIYEVTSARILLPIEELCVQCIPLTLPRSSEFAQLSPWTMDFLETLSDKEIKSMAGNSMILPVVGSVLLAILCMADWTFPAKEKGEPSESTAQADPDDREDMPVDSAS